MVPRSLIGLVLLVIAVGLPARCTVPCAPLQLSVHHQKGVAREVACGSPPAQPSSAATTPAQPRSATPSATPCNPATTLRCDLQVCQCRMTDVIEPTKLPPKECSNGCDQWSSQGPTINQLWSFGSPPANAASNCAQPALSVDKQPFGALSTSIHQSQLQPD